NKDIRRLQITVNDALLVRVLYRVADCDEELEALGRREILLVAILRDLDPADQFHHEIRTTSRRRASVEYARDVGMIHHRQRLALLLEARDHLLGVHPQLDDLERDAPFDRFVLLGHPYHAEAALADLLKQVVMAD